MASYRSFEDPFYNLHDSIYVLGDRIGSVDKREKGSRAISRLIYSRAELGEAADRLRQLDALGRELLELIRNEFSIEEIL
jgi:hypothetical protein